MDQTLGEKIRELREQKDMSLRELARQLGVSAAFLSDVELGRRHLSEEFLQTLATLFRIPTEELRKHDSRPNVAEIKRQSELDPKLGFAFRTAMEAVKTGKISREELIRRLTENKGGK